MSLPPTLLTLFPIWWHCWYFPLVTVHTTELALPGSRSSSEGDTEWRLLSCDNLWNKQLLKSFSISHPNNSCKAHLSVREKHYLLAFLSITYLKKKTSNSNLHSYLVPHIPTKPSVHVDGAGTEELSWVQAPRLWLDALWCMLHQTLRLHACCACAVSSSSGLEASSS